MGAFMDILSEAAFQKIKQTQPISNEIGVKCSPTIQSRLSVLGKFDANFRAMGKQVIFTANVLQGTHGSHTSFAKASNFDLVEVKIKTVTACSNLIEQYPSVFKGLKNPKIVR